MNIKQYKDLDGCLSYIMESDGACVAIDVSTNIDQYMEALNGLNLIGIIDTHIHADHLTGAELLKSRYDAPIIMSKHHTEQLKLGLEAAPEGIQELLMQNASVKVDKFVSDRDTIRIGTQVMTFLDSPGHTIDLVSCYVPGFVFTADSLHIGGIARTDLPGGNNGDMYRTLENVFRPLPDWTVVYPGHDYHGNVVSVIGYEKMNNPFMKTFSLESLANLVAKSFEPLKPGMSCSANIVPADGDLSPMAKSMCLAIMDYTKRADDYLVREIGQGDFIIDVREPDEFGEKHIPGAVNIPAGPSTFPPAIDSGIIPKNSRIVAYCRSGNRSTLAVMYLRARGFNAYSLDGGIQAHMH
jgi:sulfur dioxygenase